MDITSIVVALITGVCVAVPTIISTVVNNNTRNRVLEEQLKYACHQIEDMKAELKKYNDLVERVALLEHDTQTAFVRIDEVRNSVKELTNKHERDMEAVR